MALFKFRKRGEEQSSSTSHQPESIELLRKRAKHRLIGSAVLVLAGVILFPIIVDKQPRTIPVDIPIVIPDRHKVNPLGATQPPSAEVARAAATQKEDPAEEAANTPAAKPASATSTASAPAAPSAATAPSASTTPQPNAEAQDKPKTESKPSSDGARAQALLEGRPQSSSQAPTQTAQANFNANPASVADGTRYIVQVGAFSDDAKAREVRLKLERAGLKTYIHVAKTKDGPLTRVRLGPFTSRTEAQAAADKVKKLDLSANILTL